MALVYRHRRLDTNEIFYVGIGVRENRPYSKKNRNKYWRNIINKTNYEVEILVTDLSWEDACELEILLIKEYGRKDLKTGCLVNMTDGGEGVAGATYTRKPPTEETKLKIKNSLTGIKHTQDRINKNKKSNSGKFKYLLINEITGETYNGFLDASIKLNVKRNTLSERVRRGVGDIKILKTVIND